MNHYEVISCFLKNGAQDRQTLQLAKCSGSAQRKPTTPIVQIRLSATCMRTVCITVTMHANKAHARNASPAKVHSLDLN